MKAIIMDVKNNIYVKYVCVLMMECFNCQSEAIHQPFMKVFQKYLPQEKDISHNHMNIHESNEEQCLFHIPRQ